MSTVLFWFVIFLLYACLAHFISYYLEKNRILNSQAWGLNICCGKTDGGGVNADIVQHKALPKFNLVQDIYNLPFKDQAFETVLCSHTIEHVDQPEVFFNELQRVGQTVTIVVPPLYDIFALLNVFEHRYIFLTFKKEHQKLPPHFALPFSKAIQARIGQFNNA